MSKWKGSEIVESDLMISLNDNYNFLIIEDGILEGGGEGKEERWNIGVRRKASALLRVFRRVLINDKRAYEFHLILSGGRGKRARIKGMINAH